MNIVMGEKINVLVRLKREFTLFLFGGFIYYLIEVGYRGYSHPSMFMVGGLCFAVIGGLNNWLPWELGFVWQTLIGAVFITLIELAAGIIINIWLELGVWDYSGLPFNVLGQISLLFSILWLPLAAFGIWLDDRLRWKLFGERMPSYKVF